MSALLLIHRCETTKEGFEPGSLEPRVRWSTTRAATISKKFSKWLELITLARSIFLLQPVIKSSFVEQAQIGVLGDDDDDNDDDDDVGDDGDDGGDKKRQYLEVNEFESEREREREKGINYFSFVSQQFSPAFDISSRKRHRSKNAEKRFFSKTIF